MPTIDPVQASFNSGELSSALFGRVDLDKYRSGLRTCRNFLCHPQGGISNRCGFQYVAQAKYSGSMCVSQEFIFNQTQAYVLEFGHLYVRFHTDGAVITKDGVPYTVETPYLVGDLNDLRFEGSADVIWITHPDYQTRTLTRYDNSNWVLETYSPTDGPFMPDNTDETLSFSVSATTGTGVSLTVPVSTETNTNIVLLLHGEGADASTTITDSSSYARTVTANGNAQIDTAQKVFGSASILFDGTGDYLSFSDSTDFAFGTGNFTIKTRIRFNAFPAALDFMGIYAQRVDDNNQIYFVMKNQGGSLNSFQFAAISSGVTVGSIETSNITLNTGQWYDIMVVRDGSNFKFSLDGVFQTLASENVIGTASMPDIAANPNIGRRKTSGEDFNGWMDEVYINKGEALHTSDFTLETAAYSITSTSSISDYSFDPLQVGALFKLEHYVESQTLSVSASSATGGSSSIKCFTTWRLLTHGTWNAKFKIEKSTDGGTTWTILRFFSGAGDINFDTSGTEDIETNPVPFLIRVNVYTYTSGTLNVDLSSDPFYQVGIVQATAYVSETTLTVSVLQDVGSTAQTTLWAEGSWSAYRGYPARARFFQDRLCFASTPTEPQTLWMTETSNYYSFIRHSTLLDTDAITINLPSRQINAINGLIAFKKLLVFTSSAIWSIGPVSGSALTPSSVTTDVEEYHGSDGVVPAVIGTEAIYMALGGEIVRNIGFQLEVDSFTGDEVNILSSHLFQGYTITKMAYQRNPNNIVWFLRSDGVLLSLTYNAAQRVVAWARHDTDGTIESICVIPGDNGDELWATVSRTNGRFIERMQGRKMFDLTNHVFMDSYTLVVSSTGVVSGLDWLANEQVYLVGDSVVLASQTVSASGTLGMSASYDELQVGLPIQADAETLDINVPIQTGSMQGKYVKIGNVTFVLINTRGGYIGKNESNLYEAFTYAELDRANQILHETTLGVTDNFSGNIRVPLGVGYSKGGRIFYRQNDPLPVTISSIVPEVDGGGASS